ncbi:hypothetical protein AOLI_G00159600 [Acnodon oligacanthus]
MNGFVFPLFSHPCLTVRTEICLCCGGMVMTSCWGLCLEESRKLRLSLTLIRHGEGIALNCTCLPLLKVM